MTSSGLNVTDPHVEQLLQRLPLAVAAVDRGGRVVLINDWAVKWSGYDIGDTPTLHAWRLKAFPDDQYRASVTRAWDEAVAQADANDTPIAPRELQVVIKSGEVRSATVVGIPIAGGFLAVFVDNTERARYEAQIREAQKLRAVSTLASGVAHEFNNLLTVMLMRLELASAAPDASPRWRDEMRDVERVILQARELINELLQYAGQRPAARAAVCLADVCADATRLLQGVVPRSVSLQCATTPDAQVLGDRAQLTQLLLNLLMNALDALRERTGSISVQIDTTTIPEPADRSVEALAPGSYHRLVVADDGCGMSQEVVEQAFEPFFTTKPVGTGTGLGLAVARGIAHGHGGGLECTSAPGQGTTMTVYLPAHTA